MKVYVSHSAFPPHYTVTKAAPKVHYFPINHRGRDFVVGDIHGCYNLVKSLLGKTKFDETKDRLFATGDLVDRGPNSQDCLLLTTKPWFHSVRGNHEQFLIDSILGEDPLTRSVWRDNGGQWADKVAPTRLKLLAKLADCLPLVIVVGTGESRFNICHAEMVKAKTTFSDQTIDTWNLSKSDEARLLWGRNTIKAELRNGELARKIHDNLSLTYVGHSPIYSDEIHQRGSMVYIDTGGVTNHKHRDPNYALTMVDVYTGQCYQAQRN